MNTDFDFGKWLKKEFALKGSTIEDFHRLTGISKTTVWRHMTGKNRPNDYILNEYCKYFGIPIELIRPYIWSLNPRLKSSNSFGEWLMGWMDACCMSVSDLSKKSGVSVITIRRQINGTYLPNFDSLRKYCDLFHLPFSSVYSRFATEHKRMVVSKGSKTDFGEWLVNKMISKQLTEGKLSKLVGISRQTVNYHIRGKSKPSFKVVERYCDFFDCKDEMPMIQQMFGYTMKGEPDDACC